LVVLIHGLGAPETTWISGDRTWKDLILTDNNLKGVDVAVVKYDTAHVAFGLLNTLGIKNVVRQRDIFFRIERDDNTILNTLLLDEYRFGIASLLRALEEFPDTKYIVIGGNWNQSTGQVDSYAKENRIGIYNYSDFLGAINCNTPLKYIRKDERENEKNTFRGA
jgi:hypothetical protein